ncbi:MAG: ATPase, T2SS/T4P/T4SS family [Ignisphaera sp.]
MISSFKSLQRCLNKDEVKVVIKMMKVAFEEIYVPDTTVIIERTLSKIIKDGLIRGKIVIPKEYLTFFESRALQGSALGLLCLQEISEIVDLARKKEDLDIMILESGHKEAYINDLGYLDHIAREIAKKLGGKLLTHNSIQRMICNIMDVNVLLLPRSTDKELPFEKYFDNQTLSLHIKEGAPILAKKGKPGSWFLAIIDDRPQPREAVELLVEEIIKRAKAGEGIIEIEGRGIMLLQLNDYRVIIVTPPIGTGYEVTITRPIVRLKLEDYNLPPKVLKRLEEKAEGILIAGAPGMGKTTFAQALADYYSRKGRIVKTIESPRDMKLPPIVSQYSKFYASSRELHDILLLSRPDYTVFDEMRDDEDFKIYVDLRLAGIGMIGVVHATSPIDAIQRFIGRVDIGMIPSIIDTVMFIDKGIVTKVYEVSMTVKLPTGLREADLARPVIEVRDFLTNELEYEIYVFGEQTVVIPVKKVLKEITSQSIVDFIKKYLPYADIEVDDTNKLLVLSVPKTLYNTSTLKVIRRVKRRINKLGYDIEVRIQ